MQTSITNYYCMDTHWLYLCCLSLAPLSKIFRKNVDSFPRIDGCMIVEVPLYMYLNLYDSSDVYGDDCLPHLFGLILLDMDVVVNVYFLLVATESFAGPCSQSCPFETPPISC